ncbi:MAG: hypothetical protein ACR2N2_01525 [Acidimicrobiia bacterium]
MTDQDNEPLEPGQQPYDGMNAVRIGMLAGGILGIVAGIFVGASVWLMIGGAVLGGAGGAMLHRSMSNR